MVPAAHLALGLDANLLLLLLLDEVEGDLTEYGHGLGCITCPDARVIFVEGHIEDPMQAVLDGPM